jgi:hypothetical protein
VILLGLWFFAAFGFAFVVGHSKISLGVRVLLAGTPERKVDIERAAVPYELGHEKSVTVIATKTVPAVRPLVPVVGPFLVALAECPGCLGWWLGLLAGFFWPQTFGVSSQYVFALMLAFATSGVNLLFAKWVGLLDE